MAITTVASLIPKLEDLLKEESKYNLSKGVIKHLTYVHALLERAQQAGDQAEEELERTQQAEEERELSEVMVDIVETFTSSLASATADPQGGRGLVPKVMRSKLHTAKAHREFASNVSDAVQLYHKARDRHARFKVHYSIPSRNNKQPPVDHKGGGISSREVSVSLPDQILTKVDEMCKIHGGLKDEEIDLLKKEMECIGPALRKVAQVPVEQLDEGTKAWIDDLTEACHDIINDFRAPVPVPPPPPLPVAAAAAGTGKKPIIGSSMKLNLAAAKARLRNVAQIRGFNKILLEVAERRQRYWCEIAATNTEGEDVDEGSNRNPPPEPLQDSECPFLGIDVHTDELVKLLTTSSSGLQQEPLKLVSVVGPAGVGKKTLAEAVYSRISTQFECTARVSLSNHQTNNKSRTTLLLDLLRQLRQTEVVSETEDETETGLIDKIRETLNNKRYLIVIEDIWSSVEWDSMRNLFENSHHGSAVLTTTCKVDIAEYVGGVYKLAPLTECEATRLFYRTLFVSEDKCAPGDLANICGKLIAECGSIPLAIIAKADLLATKPWTVMKSHQVHGSYDTERIFEDYYKKLPRRLKPCLLYFSMFQKGYEMSGENLLWMWLNEGFLEAQEGEMCLNELINKGLIEAVEVDAAGKALSCRLYDMLHDSIVSLSAEEKFATILDGKVGNLLETAVRLLSIQGNNKDAQAQQLLRQAPNVRSLVVSGDAITSLMHATPLEEFQGLRVLDLGRGSPDNSLKNDQLKGIGSLFFLRCLVLAGRRITEIPKETGNLKSLQTLDLRATIVKELPATVFQAKKLKRLYVNSRTKIPCGIGKMEDLEELGDMNVSKPDLLKDLCSLTKLILLGIAIWSWDESYGDAMVENLRSLLDKRIIQSLSIVTCCSLDFMNKLEAGNTKATAAGTATAAAGNNKATAAAATPAPSSLQKLEISQSALLGLPRWIISLQNLSSLSIEVHKLTEDMIVMLGELQNLLALSLTAKHAPAHPHVWFDKSANGFRKLTGFHFSSNGMGKMFRSGAMPKLERLKLSFQASTTDHVVSEASVTQESDFGSTVASSAQSSSWVAFDFGLENLPASIEHVRVEINCFNANDRVVNQAEAAIRRAVSKSRMRPPNLVIKRVREEHMLDEGITGKEVVKRKWSSWASKPDDATMHQEGKNQSRLFN